jgi:ATP/maltotriose-dependent transcriptional regulator MalT
VLLRQAITRDIEPEYAHQLLIIIEAEERQRRIKKREISILSPTENLLSQREMEVLRFLADGISTHDIADRLVVSVNTVRTHIQHIFEKLDAKGRLQAVARAKELKLI